jgi:hypothetical protein
MMSMPRRFAMSVLTALVGVAGALALGSAATAGVLYRCEGPNGSIAYTNKSTNFTKCTELSRYDDAPVKKAPAHAAKPKAAEAASEKPLASANGWAYRENVAEKPDFASTRFGVASTAMPIRATDFGVESTAPLVKAVSPAALEVASMVAKADAAFTALRAPAASPNTRT